ncbi:hydrogenase iron-sulfur subunit [Chloroflexota bacterium]
MFSQIEAAYSVPIEASKPKVLSFLCNWCGYAAADLAGVSRIQYASNTRTIRVLCSGRIHQKFVYDAFLKGMDGVLIVGCHPADCHYISGVQQTMKTVPATQKNLEAMGIDPSRLQLEFASAAEGAAYAAIVNNFTDAMAKLGHIELTGEQRDKLLELREKRTEPKKKKGKGESVAVSDDREDTSE